MHSGPCHEDHSGALGFLGLVQAVHSESEGKKRLTKRPNYQKEKPLCHHRPGLQATGK